MAKKVDYRKKYFKKHPSHDNRYQCAYCGKTVHRNYITIDHIFPQSRINKAKKGLGAMTVLFLLVSGFLIYVDIMDRAVNKMLILLPALLAIVSFLTIPALEKFKHSYTNLVASCSTCNSNKSAKVDARIGMAILYKNPITRALVFSFGRVGVLIFKIIATIVIALIIGVILFFVMPYAVNYGIDVTSAVFHLS